VLRGSAVVDLQQPVRCKFRSLPVEETQYSVNPDLGSRQTDIRLCDVHRR
jgi:hypothetical protein